MDKGWPFLGREDLFRRVTSAIVDGPGGAVLQGGLGTGKTRLAGVVADALGSRGWHVERCIGSPVWTKIPFGVLTHLDLKLASKDLAYNLEQLRRRLLERAGTSRLLLAVDDANLIDPSTMALFHRLVMFGDAAILVTRRTGDPGNEEAITSLWKDGGANLVDVGPLARDAHDRLVAHALGPVEAASRAPGLWSLSQGNPLFLRELLNIVAGGGVDEMLGGRLPRFEDSERWTRLASIVASRVRRLAGDERDALEIVAVAEPARLAWLREIVSAAAIAELERQGMVTIDDLGDVEHVSTAHPTYGATLRATLPGMRRKTICSLLASALRRHGFEKPGDRMAAATWLLDAGEKPPAELAELAASEALGKGDPQLAERLAAAAVEHTPSVTSLITLGAARSVQHATDEARLLFERALAEVNTDDERARAALALARHEAWIEQNPSRGIAVLEAALPTLMDRSLRAELGVELAALAAIDGNVVDTAAVAEEALADAGAEPRLIVSALVWSTLARCMLGRSEGLEDDLDRGEALALDLLETLPLALDQLQINRAMWLHAVDLAAATQLAVGGHERAVSEGGIAGAWSAIEVQVLKDIGDLDRAPVVARRAIAELERFDPFHNLPMARTLLSHVHSLRSERGLAEKWLVRAGPLEAMEARTRVHGDRAQVWLTSHDAAAAAFLAVQAGERAEAGTLPLWACALYHDAVRLGVPQVAVAPLSRLAGEIRAPVIRAMARHAEAAAAGDAEMLCKVAREFEELHAYLFAAEAFAQAAGRAGATPEAARAALMATRLAARCPGAAPPALVTLVAPLSKRQSEVAEAAVAGLTSRDIAERLVLSVRTVDNHLASVYRKLGLVGREELRALMGSSPPG